jgi:lysophospholipase L1-like esterase
LIRLLPLPTNYGSVYRKKFTEIFDHLQEKYQLNMIYVTSIEGPDKKQDDHVHLSSAAQIDILNTIWPSLIKMLQSQ